MRPAAAAKELARHADLSNCEFMRTDVTAHWPAGAANLVYARFILTRLREPNKLLENARQGLCPTVSLLLDWRRAMRSTGSSARSTFTPRGRTPKFPCPAFSRRGAFGGNR
jgi:hypothetical protein